MNICDIGFGIGHMSMMVLWVIVIGAILWAIFSSKGLLSRHRDESAIEIAKKRYARGEITKQELDDIKSNL